MQPKEYRNDDGDYFKNKISNVISLQNYTINYFGLNTKLVRICII